MSYMGDDNTSKESNLLFKIHSFYKDLDPVVSPYLRVIDAIKAAVLQGLIKPGEPIPSTNSLARSLSVNPMTTVKALQNVASLRIIQRNRGSNYIVCEDGQSRCSEIIGGEILGELRYFYRKMKHYQINRNQINQWLKGFEDADKSIENAKTGGTDETR